MEGVSVQASCWSLLLRTATQTAEQHLKPEPNASCQTRSPRFTPCCVSTYVHAYLSARSRPLGFADFAHHWLDLQMQACRQCHRYSCMGGDLGHMSHCEFGVATCLCRSMDRSAHQVEDDDVLPYRSNGTDIGRVCSGRSCSCLPTSSMTALPPGWMQKCSKAVVKSGVYGLTFIRKTCSTTCHFSQPYH